MCLYFNSLDFLSFPMLLIGPCGDLKVTFFLLDLLTPELGSIVADDAFPGAEDDLSRMFRVSKYDSTSSLC